MAERAASMDMKKNRWRRGFCIYLGVLALVLVATLVVLWVALSRGQARVDADNALSAEQARQEELATEQALQDRRDLEDSFLRFAREADAEQWAQYYPETSRYESWDTVKGSLIALLSGEPTCYKAEDWSLENPHYLIYREEAPFAEVTMVKQDNSWQVGQAELLLQGDKSGSIRVPESCIVYCGGVELGEENVTERDFALREMDFPEELTTGIVRGKTCVVNGLFAEAAFRVEAPEGLRAVSIEEDTWALALQETEAETYQKKAEALVKSLVYYYMWGNQNTYNNMSAAASKTVKGSPAYEVISSTYDGVIWTNCFAGNYSCEATAGDVLVWADNCYSVDVACKATGFNGQNEKTMDGAYRIIFTDSGNGFGITGLETL